MKLVSLRAPAIRFGGAALFLLTPLAALAAQEAQQQGSTAAAVLAAERYVKPPAEIARLVTAPRHLNASLGQQSPDGKRFLDERAAGLPTVNEYGRTWYNLGGWQIDPRASRSRTMTTRGAAAVDVYDATTGKKVSIAAPAGSKISSTRWSPNGAQLAFIANFDDASYVYVADAATGRSRRLSGTPLVATNVTSIQWTGDGAGIVAVVAPANRGAEPKAPAIATGPQVRMTDPKSRNKTRTYADLLEGPHDMALVEYHATGQVAILDAKSGAVRRIGEPAMIQSVDPSPDGKFLRVSRMIKPFSYTVPVSQFGSVQELWGIDGKVIAELSKRPIRDGSGDDDDDPTPAQRQAASDTARRNLAWMPNGEGLYYLQMDPAPRRDSTAGDSAAAGNGPTRRRDRLYVWPAPFAPGTAKAIYDSPTRVSGVLFSEDAQTIFVAENNAGTGHLFAVKRSEPTKRMTIWRMRGQTASLGAGGGFGGGRGGDGSDSLSFYRNPGSLMTKNTPAGADAALMSADGKFVFLRGTQYSRAWADSAPQPFVDRVELATGTKTRIFQSPADAYEMLVAPVSGDFSQVVVARETPTEPTNYFLRTIGQNGTGAKLTDNKDYSPEITTAPRKMIQVTRADGYKFWVNVTLPPGYREGTRLPAMFWFYPYEYTDQAAYDRTKRTHNKNRFPSFGTRSMDYLVTQGYAVVSPDAPIFGERGRMNDNYVSDLRNNLSAVIDELDRQGLIDRQRLGLGGHSYGAFSTVNAMVHTPFFKAGIAGDGAYNRTLTPNGFQSEQRDLWAGRQTYLEMSPFLYADKLQGALLMYHGIEDQNVGTAPINSERLFHALQGLGKTAALYMYPYEDHGPATEETLLDLWGRWTAWLDTHVKGAAKPDIVP